VGGCFSGCPDKQRSTDRARAAGEPKPHQTAEQRPGNGRTMPEMPELSPAVPDAAALERAKRQIQQQSISWTSMVTRSPGRVSPHDPHQAAANGGILNS